MTDTTRSDRFLDIYADLERELREIAGLKHERNPSGFRHYVNEASDEDPVVRRSRDELLQVAELRNAIVHDRRNGVVIAEPHQKVVDDLEEMLAILQRDPKVKELCDGSVAECHPDQPIGEAVATMLDGEFSQLPVTQDGTIVDLLTTDTVSRWLAAEVIEDDESGLLETGQVGDVLPYKESSRNYQLVGLQDPLAVVLEQYDHYQQQGLHLDAVVVTYTGQETGEPQGIITWSDLPDVYRTLGLHDGIES